MKQTIVVINFTSVIIILSNKSLKCSFAGNNNSYLAMQITQTTKSTNKWIAIANKITN
jgi:hypothetical protein